MSKFLLDTNIHVLWVVGLAHPEWIGRQKPVSDFVEGDFDRLEKLLGTNPSFVTLPYVLAETSNLLGIGKRKTSTPSLVSEFVQTVKVCEELRQTSKSIVLDSIFKDYGLTDTAMLQILDPHVHVVTVDWALFGYLSKLGTKCTNLRNLTPLN